MGLFSRLLRRPPPAAAILGDAIDRLQVGIFTNLNVHYKSLDANEAFLLADCVLGYAILMKPLGAEAQEYQSTHSALVRQRALELVEAEEVVEALSYLYAAITLRIAMLTRNPFSEEAAGLVARATELSLYIPNTYDICGSGDAEQCSRAIATFTDNYLRRTLGQ